MKFEIACNFCNRESIIELDEDLTEDDIKNCPLCGEDDFEIEEKEISEDD